MGLRTIEQLDNPDRDTIKFGIELLCELSFAHSLDKGFTKLFSKRNPAEVIALMHSELSEALEGFRKPGASDKIPRFSQVEEEFADLIIRVCDAAYEFDVNLGEAILAKLQFNRSRPPMHGKAF